MKTGFTKSLGTEVTCILPQTTSLTSAMEDKFGMFLSLCDLTLQNINHSSTLLKYQVSVLLIVPGNLL